jgi:CO/xanthine dehydrogenase Mo-binding subunit
VKNFGLIIKDQPVLIGIGQKMRYMGDALAIVIAESKEAASRATGLIEVEVEKLEVISDPNIKQALLTNYLFRLRQGSGFMMKRMK